MGASPTGQTPRRSDASAHRFTHPSQITGGRRTSSASLLCFSRVGCAGIKCSATRVALHRGLGRIAGVRS
jgi:hypothetical protein